MRTYVITYQLNELNIVDTTKNVFYFVTCGGIDEALDLLDQAIGEGQPYFITSVKLEAVLG